MVTHFTDSVLLLPPSDACPAITHSFHFRAESLDDRFGSDPVRWSTVLTYDLELWCSDVAYEKEVEVQRKVVSLPRVEMVLAVEEVMVAVDGVEASITEVEEEVAEEAMVEVVEETAEEFMGEVVEEMVEETIVEVAEETAVEDDESTAVEIYRGVTVEAVNEVEAAVEEMMVTAEVVDEIVEVAEVEANPLSTPTTTGCLALTLWRDWVKKPLKPFTFSFSLSLLPIPMPAPCHLGLLGYGRTSLFASDVG